jgi:Peptidase family M50
VELMLRAFMNGFYSDKGPLTPAERTLYGIFLGVLLALFVAEIFQDFQPVKLSALLIILFWMPLLALHEAGHAVVAALVNWHVGQVVIGMGRLIHSFRIGSAVVEIRLFPVEGFVKCVPTNLRHPQLKSALIYFAGPGVELLLAIGILLLVGSDRLFSKSDDYFLISWQSLAVASTAQGVLNLIPHAILTPTGDMANDGLGIIRSLLRPDAHYATMIGWTYNEHSGDWEEHAAEDWWKREK